MLPRQRDNALLDAQFARRLLAAAQAGGGHGAAPPPRISPGAAGATGDAGGTPLLVVLLADAGGECRAIPNGSGPSKPNSRRSLLRLFLVSALKRWNQNDTMVPSCAVRNTSSILNEFSICGGTATCPWANSNMSRK